MASFRRGSPAQAGSEDDRDVPRSRIRRVTAKPSSRGHDVRTTDRVPGRPASRMYLGAIGGRVDLESRKPQAGRQQLSMFGSSSTTREACLRVCAMVEQSAGVRWMFAGYPRNSTRSRATSTGVVGARSVSSGTQLAADHIHRCGGVRDLSEGRVLAHVSVATPITMSDDREDRQGRRIYVRSSRFWPAGAIPSRCSAGHAAMMPMMKDSPISVK